LKANYGNLNRIGTPNGHTVRTIMGAIPSLQ
jgi:hypothetical protein